MKVQTTAQLQPDGDQYHSAGARQKKPRMQGRSRLRKPSRGCSVPVADGHQTSDRVVGCGWLPFASSKLRRAGIARFALGVAGLLGGGALLACGGPAESNHPVGSANQFVADAPGDPAHNLLKQSDFNSGAMLPWMYGFYGEAQGAAEVADGALCAHMEAPGKERWDAQLRHREMTIRQGHSYRVSFVAWAARPTRLTLKVGMMGPPYTDYLVRPIQLETQPKPFSFQFEMKRPDDPTAELAFQFGGRMLQGEGPIELCFDDVILSDPQFTPAPPPQPVTLPAVRVNQLGYLPDRIKIAVVVSDATAPLSWHLQDAQGQEVLKGTTTVLGKDADSGDGLQLIDFSSFTTPGRGFVLGVGEATSDPFDIDDGLYSTLKYDAFRYFYHNRSGVEIKMPFAGGEQWARPAGHPKDEATCAADTGCGYTLDVSGGWYDAGDHGKYVVNGGISVWTLMNWFERTKYLGGDATVFDDSHQLLPESGNHVPDILDEARWELEFMLRMQVPEGKPNAGMVHHKMHDDAWTQLGLPPHLDHQPRQLRPVSTAATLNLAAAAAQAARIWRELDPEFSARCLRAAQDAWAAAKKAPGKYALASDNEGGGPYDDADVSDEFFWAAAELFITTGAHDYLQELTASPHYTRLSPTASDDGRGAPTAMTWQRVDALGTISLAVVPSKLGADAVAAARERIERVADTFAELADTQGYRVPFGSADGQYPWGSSASVLNNMLVMALAYDFQKQPKYLNGVVLGMDYLLGRNAMAKSYVSGYGERPLQHPHHRFWAKQANPAFPGPPPGVVSGGPNSGLQDPYVKAAGLRGCAPQKCYVDHIEAWSVNEVTINWNAPLVWVTAWLDEHRK